MNESRRNGITWAFVAVTILIVAVMLFSSLQSPEPIQLPVTEMTQEQNPDESTGDALTVIEVTPKTVQAAIASLDRPEKYSRKVTIEQLWSGGSSSWEAVVAVRDGWTRTDRNIPGGQVRHTLTDGETTHIWYNSDTQVYTTAAGEITADMEQGIPTYEDILRLPSDRISAADYREISGVNCIYVETTADEAGYILRYWVSVENGLLTAAEKLESEKTVYRMASLAVEETVPADELFTLPDGTLLLAE